MSLTCVSCYFHVKSKFNNNVYLEWFENTLSINCPYVFFTNDIELIKKYRKDLPTYYIECKIEDFNTYMQQFAITNGLYLIDASNNNVYYYGFYVNQSSYSIQILLSQSLFQ